MNLLCQGFSLVMLAPEFSLCPDYSDYKWTAVPMENLGKPHCQRD